MAQTESTDHSKQCCVMSEDQQQRAAERRQRGGRPRCLSSVGRRREAADTDGEIELRSPVCRETQVRQHQSAHVSRAGTTMKKWQLHVLPEAEFGTAVTCGVTNQRPVDNSIGPACQSPLCAPSPGTTISPG